MVSLKGMKTPPKVRIISQLFYPELVSTGQTLTELGEALIKKGCEVDVICGPITLTKQTKPVPKRMIHEGMRITRVWSTSFPKLNIVGKLLNHITFSLSLFFKLLFIRDGIPSLVVTNPPFIGVIMALVRKLGGNPYIYVVFDVYPQTAIQLGVIKDSSFIAKLWHKANEFVFRHASDIVTIGRCMEAIIKQVTPPDTHSKLSRVHVWGDNQRIVDQIEAQSPNPFIERWHLEGKFVVSYSGNMGRFHDMMTIIKAAEKLQSNPSIVFLFVGEGYFKSILQDYVSKHKLNNCFFYTYVDRDEYGLSLAAADLGLVSLLPDQVGLSVPSKSFGLMAASLPILAIMPPECEIARIITEHECGHRVDPGDVEGLVRFISNAAKHPSLLTKMGENGRKCVFEKFSLQEAATSYYNKVILFQNS
jgi:glycosyltransferase involved in cell wall biosynthesis